MKWVRVIWAEGKWVDAIPMIVTAGGTPIHPRLLLRDNGWQVLVDTHDLFVIHSSNIAKDHLWIAWKER